MDTKHIDLSERSRKILKTVIHAYINDAEPVGSRTVAKKAVLGLSSATIQHPRVLLRANNACEKSHLWIQSTLTYLNEAARY